MHPVSRQDFCSKFHGVDASDVIKMANGTPIPDDEFRSVIWKSRQRQEPHAVGDRHIVSDVDVFRVANFQRVDDSGATSNRAKKSPVEGLRLGEPVKRRNTAKQLVPIFHDFDCK